MKRVHYIEWVSSVEDVGGGCSHFAQFIVRDRNPKHAKWNANVKTQKNFKKSDSQIQS